MTIDHILTLLLVVPAVGLLPLYVFRSDPRAVKQVAVVTTFVELVLSLVMLAQFRVGEAGFQLVEEAAWLPSLGIRYLVGVDGISVLLVPMTTLLTFIAVLYSSGGSIKDRLAGFMASFLVLEIGMVGVFVSLDLFLFYVMFELMLVPDVSHHRDLGRPAADLLDAQVRDLHAGRLAAHARRASSPCGSRPATRDRARSR